MPANPNGVTGTSVPAQPDDGGAPKAANPLDTSAFERDPCKLLTAAQVAELGSNIRAEKDETPVFGPGCSWSTEDGDSISAGFVTNSGGLSGVYRQNKILPKAYFIPVPSVAGYPGVISDDNDMRASGFCGIAVAVQNQSALLVNSTFSTDSPNRADPCPVVQKFAEYAVNNIKGAA